MINTKFLIVLSYLLITLFIGIWGYRFTKKTLSDYFLANRTLGGIVLFFTMAATNFSAFCIFGFSGAGYRIGYAYYPIMSFGTGFMALTFFLIGSRVWQISKKYGIITPPEYIGIRFNNTPLRLIYLAVMIIFTIPYLAIQPMGAGYALKELLGIPYFWGATLITVFIILYVFLGGMRGVVWSDVLQGTMMLSFMILVLLVISKALGGFSNANLRAFHSCPELFSRPGLKDALLMKIWFSYMLLWFFCDPMFPQLFQRFFAAKNEKALKTTMVLYPIITGVLFFLPVAIGVLGHTVFPELVGKASDSILPMMIDKFLPGWLGAVVIAGAIAALMSTADSQLLTLSSMFTRDIYEVVLKRKQEKDVWVGKIAVIVLAGLGLLMAYKPPATILEIATETFTGLAVLFPITLASLYFNKVNPWAGIASIVVGEILVVLSHFKLFFNFGFLPVIPIIGISSFILIIGSLLFPYKNPMHLINQISLKTTLKGWIWFLIFGGLFILSCDFWAWNSSRPIFLGLPWWLWYFFGLNILLVIAMLIFVKSFWNHE
ncbi:sodium:solute symporter family protein [candidate division WOR-3 bacterium]|nr:sodium:solute symporter family protein [candidate division WOR-3 bacterium]